MAKKIPSDNNEPEKIHLQVESWEWQTTSPRWTWKHWLALAMLIAVAILFAFGFLIIASVVLIVGIILNIVFFIFRKLS
ncbi:MAG: hypothetical protein JSR85_02230 [Proteobacteria bacterium]|nr:hypothetical protein [Pseudomonadota bacterium]